MVSKKAELVAYKQPEISEEMELAILGRAFDDQAKKNGRPTLFKPEIVKPILARLAGGETLTSICADDDMPSYETVWLWRQIYPSFSKVFERARTGAFTDNLVDQALDRSFQASDKESAMCARVASETALKVASRIAPHRWGERNDGSGGVNILIQSPLVQPGTKGPDQGAFTIDLDQVNQTDKLPRKGK